MAARDGARSWCAECKSLAQSPTHKQTLTVPVNGITDYILFTQFDPALGTLTGISVAMTTMVSGTVSVENLGLAPVTIAAQLPVSLGLAFYLPPTTTCR